MKKILLIFWKAICILGAIAYVLSSVSSFVPPSAFSFISVLGLAFPYILVLYVLCCITNLFSNSKRALLMAILLPLGYFNFISTFALRAEIPWQAGKDSTTLRVMTWNVQSFTSYLRKKESKSAFRTSKADMLELIHILNPDVLCMQEYRNLENAKRLPIRKELDSLGYKYHYCSNDKTGHFLKNKAVLVQDGVAIYSKYPFTDSARININHAGQNENLIYTDIIFNNKPVRIFTAHLESFEIYSDTSDSKYDGDNIYEMTYKKRGDAQYKIRETEIKHEQEVNIIRAAINKTNKPAIYCGDLNITPTSYNYRTLRGKNLQDAFLEKGTGLGNTFYKIGPTLRIDVCLPDTAFSVQQCKREKKKLSDHYPVVADMKWK